MWPSSYNTQPLQQGIWVQSLALASSCSFPPEGGGSRAAGMAQGTEFLLPKAEGLD